MKRNIFTLLLMLLMVQPVLGKDLRKIYDETLQEKSQVYSDISKKENEFNEEKKKTLKELKELEAEYEKISRGIESLSAENTALKKKSEEIEKRASQQMNNLKKIESAISASEKDFMGLSMAYPEQLSAEVSDDPIKRLEQLSENYFKFLNFSGEVQEHNLPINTQSGKEKLLRVISLGNFAYLYNDGEEFGYLERDSRNNFSIVQGATFSARSAVKKYITGDSDSVGFDLTSGAVYKQWKNRITPISQIKKGGVMIIPIFLAAVIALILILERLFMLYIKGIGDEKKTLEIADLLQRREFREGKDAIVSLSGTPVGRVAMSVYSAREFDRDTRSDILEQALIKETIPLERNLSLLSAIASAAPMLGLLGTVAGMISTFHAITVFGTGDPKVMAGGISEALTTTMLGLTVAIPVMLINTVLSRRAEALTDRVQEQGMRIYNSMDYTSEA